MSESEKIKAVVEDLEYLQNNWFSSPKDSELRRGSAILRRLLVENEFGNAWRILGFLKEPNIIATNLDEILKYYDPKKLVYAFAGGAISKGVIVTLKILYEGDEQDTPKETIEKLMHYSYSLCQFLSSATACFKGDVIRRRELIQYIANVKGGVHLGSRKKREEKLVRRVSKIEKQLYVFDNEGLYHEILSIGQCLAQSVDCRSLINAYHKHAT